MWFADIGLDLGWALLAGWLIAVTLAAAILVVRAAVPRPASVLGGSGAAAALFTAQAVVVDRVADIPGTGPLDRSALDWFLGHRDALATGAMRAVSTLGGTAGMAVLAVIGALVLWWARRRAAAGVVLGAAIGAGLLVEGFKHLYQRARPPVIDRLATETSFALPSGHALGSMVVLGVLAAAVVILARRRVTRIGVITLAALGTATIGASRIYLGVHWATDVLTGWLLGGAWLALCVTALVLLAPRSPGPLPSTRRRREGNRNGADVPATAR